MCVTIAQLDHKKAFMDSSASHQSLMLLWKLSLINMDLRVDSSLVLKIETLKNKLLELEGNSMEQAFRDYEY